MNVALINAGGIGSRFGDNVSKQFYLYNNKPVLIHCIDIFERNTRIDQIYCICSEENFDYVESLCKQYNITKFVECITSGSTANLSRRNGINHLNLDDNDIVIFHDACRITTSDDTINKLLDGVILHDAAVCGQTINADIFKTDNEFATKTDCESLGVFVNSMPFGCKYNTLKAAFSQPDQIINSCAGPMGVVAKYGIDRFYKIEIPFIETLKITYKSDIDIIRLYAINN